MDCGTFLDGYSEYRDDVLDAVARGAFEAHVRACGSCARYDRVVREGVRVLTSGPELEVSDGFMERLQHRLHHVDDEMAMARRPAAARRLAPAAAIAAGLAAAALLPQLPFGTPESVMRLPSVVASSPETAGLSRVATAPEAAGAVEGLTARLEEVGVRALPLPYRDVVHLSASRVTLAAYGSGE